MSTVTKRDLVNRIANDMGMIQLDVLKVIQRLLDCITESVKKGDKVELRNFGVFEVRMRKARVGRNPNAPKSDVRIPPRAVVRFKAGKEMREGLQRHVSLTESPRVHLRSSPNKG